MGLNDLSHETKVVEMGGLEELPPKCEKECETAFPTNTNSGFCLCHLPLNRSFEKFGGTYLVSIFLS